MYSYMHVVLFFLSVHSASAFVRNSPLRNSVFVRRDHRQDRHTQSTALGAATTETSLYFKDDDDEQHLSTFDETALASLQYSSPLVPPTQQATTKEIFLPRHSDESAEKARVLLSDAELLVGRVAMLAALLLLGVEVTTGTSLPDQLSRMCA